MKPGMADDGEPGGAEDSGSGREEDGEPGAGDERVPRRTGVAGFRDPVDLVLELVEIDPVEVRCGISLGDSGDSNDSDQPDDSNGSGDPDEE